MNEDLMFQYGTPFLFAQPKRKPLIDISRIIRPQTQDTTNYDATYYGSNSQLPEIIVTPETSYLSGRPGWADDPELYRQAVDYQRNYRTQQMQGAVHQRDQYAPYLAMYYMPAIAATGIFGVPLVKAGLYMDGIRQLRSEDGIEKTIDYFNKAHSSDDPWKRNYYIDKGFFSALGDGLSIAQVALTSPKVEINKGRLFSGMPTAKLKYSATDFKNAGVKDKASDIVRAKEQFEAVKNFMENSPEGRQLKELADHGLSGGSQKKCY